jgi:formate--tetrahydrofolate ligase
MEENESNFEVLYKDDLSLKDKIKTVATEIYGAGEVTYASKANIALRRINEMGLSHLPVCIAKTQYSLSDNPKLLGRPEGFEINVREINLSAGAEFIVAITGNVMTMPGLPKVPSAEAIDIDADGNITGLF